MEEASKGKGMFKAYQVAQEMIRDRLEDQNKKAAKELDDIQENEVIVARGCYDFIERVFEKMEMPHKVVDPSAFDAFGPSPEQIVFLNCPGKVPGDGVQNLVNFVEQGGFLFTTDWALKHVIEPGFPGTIRYNGRATGDEVVRVEIDAKEDPFLQSLISEEDDPQWWLEGSSYPIEILEKDRVEVLVQSREVKDKYGESPVFTSFDYGKGKVYHMISHFYLQRTETRTERHRRASSAYMEEKLSMNTARREKYRRLGVESSSLGEVESAYSSSALMGSVLYEKSVRLKEIRDDEL